MIITNSSQEFARLTTDEEFADGHGAQVQSNTPEQILDGLLSKVGYGLFQKKLLILCGFGWLADNMWLQTIAIILPRVQEHYSVPDKWIGTLSSSLFAGMTFGAFFWGSYSDSRGRKLPYTMTLAITTLFGLISSFTFNFASLCFTLFFLGFGVGGNMPTDGALYLEFLPREYHYLLTFMSVFFSFGAVFASVLGYMILPNWSCPETAEPCDVQTQNKGWRILLFSVSVVTFVMLLLRSLWVKLPETPKFLMSQDRHNETIIVLQDIAKINGGSVQIEREELPDMRRRHPNSPPQGMNDDDYDLSQTNHMDDNEDDVNRVLLSSGQHGVEEIVIEEKEKGQALRSLLSPQWRRTTLLIWAIWTITSVAYTMFNVFLPKFLETLGFEGEAMPSREQVYWDYMIYSLAGVPGSVIASWLIETRLGRKGTMAVSAFGSSLSLFIFSIISSRFTMVISSSAVSFLATLLYAVIYGYTPEVFDTNVRGTAVGTASGLGRIAGIASPIVSGILLTINTSLPLYVSVIGFGIVSLCVVLLPFETRGIKSPSM
ncbi:major facilitator superfamily domain-containing protein [Gilbertella persicaria]|uniref:major facilitator superfamily domain-containing protein n=1 Tax=Gilbertella persicaria TaxID=101096 RepID=UPI00221E3BAB|nr:major facilitator superfamily domain-containing protein [Gilbertella persicaria]KAI8080196.1 major facilitator superfamily domain-containing protein [Gilbertella persicaria]